MRYSAIVATSVGAVVFALAYLFVQIHGFREMFLTVSLLCIALTAVGAWDMIQPNHSLKRNYPILANIRFFLEKIRPEIRQYFLESETDGTPFNRAKRSVAYQRAKGQLDKRPFGTQQDIYASNYEWINHSIAPRPPEGHNYRVVVGGPDCKQPYSHSLLNISAMSFGALSANAIRALNKGAKLGGFAHDTGEGGFSKYHREFGGDIVWELGSGYFGCRNEDGSFSPERFEAAARDPQIKMIEIKLSQGAKPGHGGVLPAPKVSREIATARGVPMGVDCVSPARHPAFATPVELVHFIARLRELAAGKPVGFKLCIGHPWEFMAICKAMLETGIRADFIVIDGKEGGTGASPLEFADHIGTPMREGLIFAHNTLTGAGLRDTVRLGASGRIITGFDLARVLALGADWCNIARGFMFALGCVQAQTCHTDRCPSGVATQNQLRQRAIVVETKAERVARFHHNTLAALGELVGAAGLAHPNELRPQHILKRMSASEVKSFAEVYKFLAPRELIAGTHDPHYAQHWAMADHRHFAPKPEMRTAA
ncbi:MAG: FMN-binding glutamate synthase family protein [Xanthobacteraceae bacterium]|jgi:glutamate synthase domain-containing protein 2